VRAPQTNGDCEHDIDTIQREYLDGSLTLGRRHLETALAEFIKHYNPHRPHRSLNRRPPSATAITPPAIDDVNTVNPARTDLLGGSIHDYHTVTRAAQIGPRHPSA